MMMMTREAAMRRARTTAATVVLAALCAATILAAGTPGTIETVAGNGTSAYSGDGGPATAASLYYPDGVASDAAGNVFVADSHNHRVRRIDAVTGYISTVAGTGTAGYAGDGGLATAAQINLPNDVAVDAVGNLVISDSNNHCIRRVAAATGNISTIAGTGGVFGYAGDGGLATAALFRYPAGVVIDSAGNIVVVDGYNSRIRRIEAATGIIMTIAGSATSGYGGDGAAATAASLGLPHGVAVDSAGNILFADSSNHRVRRIAAATGIITTVAGNGTGAYAGDGGLATAASLNNPYDVAVDGTGSRIIADTFSSRIRRVDTATGVITTVAGNGAGSYAGDGGLATSASIQAPFGVAIDAAGNLLVSDTYNQRIRRVFTTSPPANSFTLLYDPLHAKKPGSVIPIKLRVTNAGGANVSSPSLVVQATAVVKKDNSAEGTLSDAGNSNPENNFRYDAGLGGYIFNLSTTGMTSGTWCVKFTIGGVSSSSYEAVFNIK